ncbi:glycosyltransferase family 4 protein [Cytophaga sp. FL35]|uniref:glycosyltransferase n=1 Tax=Cytophaga sp. FL35 TaxID=1904456 RepID=UPI00165387C4|nr:glycosyltransferase family 4 protein [Cytophaga sp. FL35]MBC7000041.1 glycosyltransferase [Cytophaga sp. FL35]
MQLANSTVLFIGYNWPEPKTTAAGNRIMQLLQFFLDHKCQITFASTAKKDIHSTNLTDLGIQMSEIELNNSNFDEFIKKLCPNVVVFDRFLTEEQFGWRVTEHTPEALKILDTEDLHSLRKTREIALKKGEEFTLANWYLNDLTKREVASIYRCDLSLIISSYEFDLLKGILKTSSNLLMHLPFMLPEISKRDINSWPSFNDRKDFICIGTGKHLPNVDAIVWLKSKIWPKIRKALPNSQVHIYGAYFPQQLLEMHHPKQGFLIKGWIDDAGLEMCTKKVNIAPLRYGAGIKGKLMLAMQNGTPNVTTSIGSEGMHDNLPWNGFVTDSADDFAQKCIEIFTNEKLWNHAQRAGSTIINEFYEENRLKKDLAQKLNFLLSNLTEHRGNNFTGSLLHHQSMQATKFMAKWIEEKTQNRK